MKAAPVLVNLVAFLAVVIYQVVMVVSCGIAIDGTLDRAQVSVRPDLMADRLDEVIKNMEDWGVISGHAGLIHSPSNDVGADYKAFHDVRDRARAIAQQDDSASSAYQNGMIDMRQTLTQLHVNAEWYYIIHSWMTLLAILLFFSFWITGSIVLSE